MVSGNLIEQGETLSNLAAYLMMAHHYHMKYILGQEDDPEPDKHTIRRVRVTQHYASALLDYGLPPSEPELKRIADCFSTPFPPLNRPEIDQIEMTKLEGLLNLNPQDFTIQPRLKQLVHQRLPNGFFEIARDSAPSNTLQIFDTLWALKILLLARRHGFLKDLITDEEIGTTINKVLEADVQGQDLALALRLKYEFDFHLPQEQETRLEVLVQEMQAKGNIWISGRRDKEDWLKGVIAMMNNQLLNRSIIGDNDRVFREVIQNNCYLIENLAALREGFPIVQTPLRESVSLWLQQFANKDAAMTMRSFFSEDYDFLLVLCRTLIAVRALVGRPLGSLFWLHNMRDRVRQEVVSNDWEGKASIETALRKWLRVEVENQPRPLYLGWSGANVVRIDPEIFYPTDVDKEAVLTHSLIVKYGLVSDIDKERSNYRTLPDNLQDYFVRIPEETHIDEANQAFVIMEDLEDYETLYEAFPILLRGQTTLAEQLADFLMEIHQLDHNDLKYAYNTHIGELYILPMLDYVGRIFTHIQSNKLLPGDEGHLSDIQAQTVHLLSQILQLQHQIKRFPLTFMHGDLHSRNIMVQYNRRARQSWGKVQFDFKLIDLESLRPDGDVAYDVGELLVDLRMIGDYDLIQGRIDRQMSDSLLAIREGLQQIYIEHAHTEGDESFETRLNLAQALAYIRVAKGVSKRSGESLIQQNFQKAGDNAQESVALTETAVLYLETALKAMRPLQKA